MAGIVDKCGAPTETILHKIIRVSQINGEIQQETITVEDWIYDFGSRRFLVVLRFNDGYLVNVQQDFGYGRAQGAEPNRNKKVRIGDPGVLVLYFYGPPSSVEATFVDTGQGRDGVQQFDTVATWTYNLDSGRLSRTYHFVNGYLTGIETSWGS